MSIVLIIAVSGCGLLAVFGPVPVNPIAGVELTRRGSEYVVAVQNCHDRSKELALKAVTVTKVTNGRRAGSPHCRVWWKDFNIQSVKTWTYGTVPPGYESDVCEPLVPGETYEVSVSAGAGGTGVFSIKPDGSVKAIKSGC